MWKAKPKLANHLTILLQYKVAAGAAVTLICNEAAMFTITKAGTLPT